MFVHYIVLIDIEISGLLKVWKDVDGIMTSDPRLVKNAKPVDAITYEEAAELAYFGAEVPLLSTSISRPFLSNYSVIFLRFCTLYLCSQRLDRISLSE